MKKIIEILKKPVWPVEPSSTPYMSKDSAIRTLMGLGWDFGELAETFIKRKSEILMPLKQKTLSLLSNRLIAIESTNINESQCVLALKIALWTGMFCSRAKKATYRFYPDGPCLRAIREALLDDDRVVIFFQKGELKKVKSQLEELSEFVKIKK